MTSHPVYLYVYDISNGLARTMSPMIVGKLVEGIWHTSIVIHNKEFYFQGGTFGDAPKTTPFGLPVKEIKLGETELSKDELEQYIDEVKHEFTAEKYDIFQRNCNHYSTHLSEFLVGEPIPNEYLNQAKEFEHTPIGSFIKSMNEAMKKQVISSHPSNYQQPQYNFNQLGGQQTTPSGPSNITEFNDDLGHIQFISANEKCVVDFGADWCGPCKMIKPIYKGLATQYKGRIAFAEVNGDHAKQLTSSLGIKGFPTFIFFHNGNEIKRLVGANSTELKNNLDQLANLK